MSSTRPSRRSKRELTFAYDDDEPSRKRVVNGEEAEASIDLPCEYQANQKLNDDGRPSREMTSPSISPLVPSDSRETDNLCPATHRLNSVDCQKMEKQLEDGSNSDPPMCPSWDAIPYLPLEWICHYLFNTNDGTNLANLAKVSHHYNNGVMKFMREPNNRPGIKKVRFWNKRGKLMVSISLFASNFPFYELASLDKERFNRIYRGFSPTLEVKLSRAQLPVIEKVVYLLSAAISTVKISACGLSSSGFSLCKQLLRSSTIGALEIIELHLNNTTAPIALFLAFHSKKINVINSSVSLLDTRKQQLDDPASFIVQLDSMPRLSSVFLTDYSLNFFGLPISFWEIYMNEKLSNGSIEWVKVRSMGIQRKIMKAPIGINPDVQISSLKWEKRNSK